MSAPKKKTSFSISEQADDLLSKLAEHYGISRSAVLEVLIRQDARKLKLV